MFCDSLITRVGRIADYGCTAATLGNRPLIKGAVGALGGSSTAAAFDVESRVSRVVVTLRDGTTRTGVPVEGYGFGQPLVAVAVGEANIVRVDAYGADGRHLGHSILYR
jgi:hypothetical protein